MTTKTATWTYGLELELGDWDTRKGWKGYGRDPEPSICNSNGIAGDPTLKDCPFGGEINTPPTSTPSEQGELVEKFIRRHKYISSVNHGIGLQVHIRIPGLIDDLKMLKVLQKYITENVDVYQLIDPLPYSTFQESEKEKGNRKWVQWLRMSHHTAIPEYRVAKQLKAKTTKDFFNLEAPFSREGKPLFHAQPRASINLRQLLQTDTIEFRPFFSTLNPDEVINSIRFCRDYLLAALDDYPAAKMFKKKYDRSMFPPMPVYKHWREKRWAATSHSKNKREVIRKNIQKILAGDFDDVSNEPFKHLEWKLPWL